MASIERLVEQQVRRWEEVRRVEARRIADVARAAQPVVTVSRQAGSGGSAIAQAVAEQLGFPLFDREVLTYIARRKGIMESVLSVLDRHGHSQLEESLALVVGRVRLSSDDYLHELSRAILALSQQGAAVFLGRGAERILPATRRLAVRVIAPLEWRVQRWARDRGTSPEQSANAVDERDERRRRFVREHFCVDGDDPTGYDLVLNASRFSVPATASLISSAHRAMAARLP